MVFKTTKQLKGSKLGDIPEGRAGYYRWYHRVYRSRQGVIRHPEGIQIVVRSTNKEMWVVCHGFAGAEKDCIQIPLSGAWSVADGFGAVSVEISETSLLVKDVKEWSGFAFLLKQN